MSEKKNTSASSKKNEDTTKHTKKKKTNKMVIKHSKFLWFALVIAIIPFALVGYMLVSASLQTGKPIYGNRFNGDLEPKIEDTQLAQIDSNIKTMARVEGVEVNLMNATLRILVDVEDAMSVADAKKVGNSIVTSIFSVVNEKAYFQKIGVKKMYDLEVYVMSEPATSTVTPTMNILFHKTSGMESVSVEVLSSAKNQKYVDSLTAKETSAVSGS